MCILSDLLTMFSIQKYSTKNWPNYPDLFNVHTHKFNFPLLAGKCHDASASLTENMCNKGAGWKPGDWHDDSPPVDDFHKIAPRPPLGFLCDEHEWKGSSSKDNQVALSHCARADSMNTLHLTSNANFPFLFGAVKCSWWSDRVPKNHLRSPSRANFVFLLLELRL